MESSLKGQAEVFLPLLVVKKNRVANLWTEFPAHHGYAMAANGKEYKNPSEPLVAATFEKAKT